VREGIFSRSLSLATRDLRIVPCRLGDRAGVIGGDHGHRACPGPDEVDRSLRAVA
jgi:hypothetical protein